MENKAFIIMYENGMGREKRVLVLAANIASAINKVLNQKHVNSSDIKTAEIMDVEGILQ